MDVDVALWMVIAAAVPGVAATVVAVLLWVSLRRTRAAQKALLPDGVSVSVVDRQASLQRAIDRVEGGVADLESLIERQGEITERELRSALRFQGLVRYDAYRDMGGQQSWSIALLDGTKSGAVISCLHARDHARVYLKEIFEGVAAQRLSPEEERALASALGQTPPPPRPEPLPPPPDAGGSPHDSVLLAEDDDAPPGAAGARAA
jgi:hypothetical protein